MKTLATLAMLFVCAHLCAGWRVLLVESYDIDYPWSASLCEGVAKTLYHKADLKIVHMDTKKKPSEEEKKLAAKKAYDEFMEWTPDVVIAADDNAVAYFLVPYIKDKDVPMVFCGVNWDTSQYGLPDKNSTGMIEVSMLKPLCDHLRKFAKGDRISFLGCDNETDHKEAQAIEREMKRKVLSRYVLTFEEWKKNYIELQGLSDFLILYSSGGIEGWNDDEAKRFVLENTRIPSGATMDFMIPFTMITFAKSAEEQGEWSANAALRILKGEKPSNIPLVKNRRTSIYLNIPLADKLDIKFPLELIRTSKVVR